MNQIKGDTYILLDVSLCTIAECFFASCAVFWRARRASQNTLTTSKNSQRYYTTKRLIRDLLSNTPNWCVLARISWIFIYRECVIKVCEAERNWRGKSSQLIGQWQETCLTGPLEYKYRYLYSAKCSWIIRHYNRGKSVS